MELSILSQSGHRHIITLPETSTIAALKSTLLESWPLEFNEQPTQADQIRLICAGKVLHDSQVVSSLGDGRKVVVHISVRPENTASPKEADKKKSSCCTVM